MEKIVCATRMYKINGGVFFLPSYAYNKWIQKKILYYFSYSILTVKFGVTDFAFVHFVCLFCSQRCLLLLRISFSFCCVRHMHDIFTNRLFFFGVLDIVVSLLHFRVNCQENNIIFHTRYVTCTCLWMYIRFFFFFRLPNIHIILQMQKVMAQVFFVIFRALLLTERLNEEGDDLVKWRDIITNIFCVDCVCWFLTWVTLHSQNRMYFRSLYDFLFYFTLVCCNVTIATACAYMNVCVLYTVHNVYYFFGITMREPNLFMNRICDN